MHSWHFKNKLCHYFLIHCKRRNNSESQEERRVNEMNFLLVFAISFLSARSLTFLGYKYHKCHIVKQSDLSAISLYRNPDVSLAQLYNTFLLRNRIVDNIWPMKTHSRVLESHNFKTRNDYRYQLLHCTDEEATTRRLWLASLSTS